MTDLFDQLQGREQPTVELALPQDPGGYAAAERVLEEARRALLDGQVRGVDLEPLQGRVDAAVAALAEQPLIEFTIRAIPASQWDGLVAQFPATAEQRKLGWQWNTLLLRPALLAVTVSPAMSDHEWHVVADKGQLGSGELDLLFAEAVNLSNRAPRVDVGKG